MGCTPSTESNQPRLNIENFPLSFKRRQGQCDLAKIVPETQQPLINCKMILDCSESQGQNDVKIPCNMIDSNGASLLNVTPRTRIATPANADRWQPLNPAAKKQSDEL